MYPEYGSVSAEVLATYAGKLELDHEAWPTWSTASPLDLTDKPTHVEMFSWHDDRAGWVGEKSNFEVARELVRSAADEGRADTEISDVQVLDWGGGSSAWDVAQLFVQVFEDDGETYTDAFRVAVTLAEYVKNDHPFLDEDDYLDQKNVQFEEHLSEALDDIRLHYPYDSSAEHDSICEYGRQGFWDLDQYEDGYADWDAVREVYEAARNEHYLDAGREFMRNEITGQLALVVAGV